MVFCFRIGSILLNRNFSNTFERTGNKLIGLYELNLAYLPSYGKVLQPKDSVKQVSNIGNDYSVR